jgi:hypothetical protein
VTEKVIDKTLERWERHLAKMEGVFTRYSDCGSLLVRTDDGLIFEVSKSLGYEPFTCGNAVTKVKKALDIIDQVEAAIEEESKPPAPWVVSAVDSPHWATVKNATIRLDPETIERARKLIEWYDRTQGTKP